MAVDGATLGGLAFVAAILYAVCAEPGQRIGDRGKTERRIGDGRGKKKGDRK